MSLKKHQPPLQVDTFLPYMRDVIRCERALQELNLMWRMIESSAKMNCPIEAKAILPTMAATRDGFTRLEQELVSSLVVEKVSNVLSAIGTKAQNLIDILIRNLYERTADVGFLATDNVLAAFVAGETDDHREIKRRLRDYRDKYTVYDDIILLDTFGKVLAQVDQEFPVEASSDALIEKTLNTDAYVETFRYCDLRPGKKRALIYSKRISHPVTKQTLGLLCLCFNFEEEMAGIFQSHGDSQGRSIMLLLNADNKVIESSDQLWIPLDAKVPVDGDNTMALQTFSGREYLIRTFATQGYQGYMGPTGWRGQVMIPVDVSFSGDHDNVLSMLPPHIKEGVLSHAKSFSPPLFEIMNAAENIRRVVWNGQVMSSGQTGDQTKLKAVLVQISETANRSNELFSNSIGDLYSTVLTSGLKKTEFVSHLLVDLLDRNLYERANDCRWWAATPELRAAMSKGTMDAQTNANLAKILQYINSLYTVYTRLYVYRADGEIVASTLNGQDDPMSLGGQVASQTLGHVRALASDQSYYVTPFEDNALYDGAPTYVYHAAIRSVSNKGAVVGGIGIVFNSAVELDMMLRDALGNASNSTGFFADRSGKIIASTDAKRPVGSKLDLDIDMSQIAAGKRHSKIVEHDGQYAVMGCSASSGYREFKVSDGYKDDVLAIVYDPIGPLRQTSPSSARIDTVIKPESDDSDQEEYAIFVANGVLYALPAKNVLEAIPAKRLTSVPTGSKTACIGLLDLQHMGSQVKPAWVFDLNRMVQGQADKAINGSQILLIENAGRSMGLMVDELHDVKEFSGTQIIPSPFYSADRSTLIHQLIKANRGSLLIQSMCVNSLFNLSLDLA
jgi:chemotaxis signal transduction protein